MKTKKLHVPRTLIKSHFHHPEPYGESIVELTNGMITDVYTDSNGVLYTKTNNKDLIDYLRLNQVEDKDIILSRDTIKLRTFKHQDATTLQHWMNSKQSHHNYDLDDAIIFISHVISSQSHGFMLEFINQPIGTLSYIMIDEVAIIDIKIYEATRIDEKVMLDAIRLFIRHIKISFNPIMIKTTMFKYECQLIKILQNFDFLIETKRVPIFITKDKETELIELSLK